MSEPPRFGLGFSPLPSAGLGFPPGWAVSSFSWWGARFGRVFLFLFFSTCWLCQALSRFEGTLGWGEPDRVAGRPNCARGCFFCCWGGGGVQCVRGCGCVSMCAWGAGVIVSECVGLFVCVCVYSCVAPPLGSACCGRSVDVLDSEFCCPNGVGEEYFEGIILVYLSQSLISWPDYPPLGWPLVPRSSVSCWGWRRVLGSPFLPRGLAHNQDLYFVLQWNLVVRKSDVTGPSCDGVILLVPVFFVFYLGVMRSLL